jgi:hypothetical protein
MLSQQTLDRMLTSALILKKWDSLFNLLTFAIVLEPLINAVSKQALCGAIKIGLLNWPAQLACSIGLLN